MKKIIALLALLSLISGCMTKQVAPDPSILRVGVSPNSQPLIYKQNSSII